MKIKQLTILTEARRLLQTCTLPSSDLKINSCCLFFGLYDKDALTACIGVELYGSLALLRSLAVLPESRGKENGIALVNHIEALCKTKDIQEIYLLTTTAALFFKPLGYTSIPRDLVPEAIMNSSQYSSVCPDSATIMVKKLTSD